MDTSLCRLCKEPITNFVCPDHLAAEIAKWVPSTVTADFTQFSQAFSRHFHSSYHAVNPSGLPCTADGVFCRATDRGMVCVHCYVNEVYHWLAETDRLLADRFLDIFSFGFRKDGFSEHTILENFQPIHDAKQGVSEGFCDDCGHYSELLVNIEGRWLCDNCED